MMNRLTDGKTQEDRPSHGWKSVSKRQDMLSRQIRLAKLRRDGVRACAEVVDFTLSRKVSREIHDACTANRHR